MKEKKRNILLAATFGTKEITDICAEMTFNLTRLLEFTEDERSTKIIEELAGKTADIAKHCVAITAICKTIADGKSDYKSVEETIDKILDEKGLTSDN